MLTRAEWNEMSAKYQSGRRSTEKVKIDTKDDIEDFLKRGRHFKYSREEIAKESRQLHGNLRPHGLFEWKSISLASGKEWNARKRKIEDSTTVVILRYSTSKQRLCDLLETRTGSRKNSTYPTVLTIISKILFSPLLGRSLAFWENKVFGFSLVITSF